MRPEASISELYHSFEYDVRRQQLVSREAVHGVVLFDVLLRVCAETVRYAPHPLLNIPSEVTVHIVGCSGHEHELRTFVEVILFHARMGFDSVDPCGFPPPRGQEASGCGGLGFIDIGSP